MALPINVSRRRLLAGLAAGLAAVPLKAVASTQESSAPRPVRVLTSYPDEMMSRFESAFEAEHPEYRLRLDWRMPRDVLPYLRQAGQNGIDVYWAASPRTFATLAGEGRFRKLDIDVSGLPDRIGKAPLADPVGYYRATEMAGFGFVINPIALYKLGLPAPEDWTDLADSRYAGLIALPDPARVGFAPPMVEIVLQALGWQAGWALWSEIAGNTVPLGRGSTFVTDEVASGRAALGLSIDFFAVAAIANGAPLKFIYPRHGGINPAHVAITTESSNPEGARAFVEFILSKTGQGLLAHPDIRKLPVRPAVYGDLPRQYYNPFSAAERGGFDYDGAAARPRLGLSSALFHQMLMADHAEHAALWRRIQAAEAAGKDVAAARRALSTPSLSESEAADLALRDLFRDRLEANVDDPASTKETVWRKFAAARRAEAEAVLRAVSA